MEVLEAIKTRRSIRRYKKDRVPKETLEKVLEAGSWAPSGGNIQPWKFIILTDPEIKRQVAKYFLSGRHLDEAPLAILVVIDPGTAFTPTQDGTLAVYSMMLAAHSLGLGTCWVHPGKGYNDEGVKDILDISRDKRVICALPLGYPAEAPTSTRKKLEEIAFRERWGNKY